MLIRKALLADLPSLIDLVDQLGYQVAQSILAENVKLYLHDSDHSLLVAEIEGKVVGCVASDMAQTFHREGKQMRVVSLVVDRAFRKKGVGAALLQAVENLARKQGCWVVELTSSSRREKEGTHDFYIRQGYLKNGSQAIFRKLIDSL